jgi:diamine N-acetyltransferase
MIAFRTPRPDEAASIACLGRETFTESFGHIYAAADLATYLEQVYTKPVVAAELVNPLLRYQIVEENGQLVGYCKIGLGVTLDYDPGDKKVVELKQLYLRGATHGTGIGQTLMDWAIEQATLEAADEMILSVYSDNPRAQRFYERNGFSKIADTFFMVGDHRDEELLYMKIIA